MKDVSHLGGATTIFAVRIMYPGKGVRLYISCVKDAPRRGCD